MLTKEGVQYQEGFARARLELFRRDAEEYFSGSLVLRQFKERANPLIPRLQFAVYEKLPRKRLWGLLPLPCFKRPVLFADFYYVPDAKVTKIYGFCFTRGAAKNNEAVVRNLAWDVLAVCAEEFEAVAFLV